MAYRTILVSTEGRVATIALNRPEALNALSTTLVTELAEALGAFDADDGIGAILLTGSAKAFAAGADIKEMAGLDFATVYRTNFMTLWDRVAATRKPLVAAVSGYALGGGCELVMMCDIVLAADTAKFGQPEITLGVIPGLGGTQRLTRAIGKAKAMDLILTGRMMSAEEAERANLVSRVVPADRLLEEARETAGRIAGLSLVSVMAAKESVNRAFETTLAEGVRFERRLFYGLFATEDQKEGMAAFIEKRRPSFTNR